eukprot:COSAG01_NODE_8546_length_2747_cov_2.238671_1_plen_229_part_00
MLMMIMMMMMQGAAATSGQRPPMPSQPLRRSPRRPAAAPPNHSDSATAVASASASDSDSTTDPAAASTTVNPTPLTLELIRMDGSTPLHEFIKYSGPEKTPHPSVVLYMFELYRHDPDMLDATSRRLATGTAVEAGAPNANQPAAPNRNRQTRRNTITDEGLRAAFAAETDADRRTADAAMMNARTNQETARTTAIFSLLQHRGQLNHNLQEQLDTGMATFMTKLFGA